jgi:peptidoglycan/LPS O-acetylase OafA/YrhL
MKMAASGNVGSIASIKAKARLKSLDGLRGVAILLVMGFHYFYALAGGTTYPYGDAFANCFLFKYGYLGVELFFIISGFVIAMTLDSCATPQEFFVRRVSRIWPPLLFCSVVTFLTIRLIPTPFAVDAGQEWINFFPSLTLTPPELWRLAYPGARFIDFPYWSLVVEVRFYIFAACTFWFLGRRNFGRNLVALTCFNILAKTLLKFASPATNDIYFQLFIPSFLPWFAAGAVFYDLYLRRLTQPRAAFYLVPLLVIIARYDFLLDDSVQSTYVAITFAAVYFGCFWLIALQKKVGDAFGMQPLVWVGACSYSIYLIHFEIGASAISTVSKTLPLFWQVASVLGIAMLVICAGRLLFMSVEQGGKRLALRLLRSKTSQVIAAQSPD